MGMELFGVKDITVNSLSGSDAPGGRRNKVIVHCYAARISRYSKFVPPYRMVFTPATFSPASPSGLISWDDK